MTQYPLFQDIMEPTLRVYFRCDKVVALGSGETLWSGPSDPELAILDHRPLDILGHPVLLHTLKKDLFSWLKKKPYVQALVGPDDCTSLVGCEILYDNGWAFVHGYTKLEWATSPDNITIQIKNDRFGHYAEIYLTITIGIEKKNAQAH